MLEGNVGTPIINGTHSNLVGYKICRQPTWSMQTFLQRIRKNRNKWSLPHMRSHQRDKGDSRQCSIHDTCKNFYVTEERIPRFSQSTMICFSSNVALSSCSSVCSEIIFRGQPDNRLG